MALVAVVAGAVRGMHLGNREARDLGLPSGNILAVSRSGELALLLGAAGRATGTLAQVPLGGGAPREILENVTAADWDPAGKSLAVVRTVDGRHRVEYPIGSVLYETQSLRAPSIVRVSPGGDLVAFFDFGEAGDYSLSVIGAKQPRQVLSRGWRAVGGVAWSPNGQYLGVAMYAAGPPIVYSFTTSGPPYFTAQTVTGNTCTAYNPGQEFVSVVGFSADSQYLSYAIANMSGKNLCIFRNSNGVWSQIFTSGDGATWAVYTHTWSK